MGRIAAFQLASFQGSPQDLTCGDQGTSHDSHVPLMIGCEPMDIQGGDREDDQHNVMRSTHTCLFHEVDAPKRGTGLHSESRNKFFHSCM